MGVDALTGQVSCTAASIAPGLMVMAFIYTVGQVGGGHLNPAVTIAFAAHGRTVVLSWREVFPAAGPRRGTHA